MNISRSCRRAAFVLAFTAVGAGLGYGLLYLIIPSITQHLPIETTPDGDGIGSIAAAIVSVGYNVEPVVGMVMAAGILITVAILGSLWAGLVLAQHIR